MPTREELAVFYDGLARASAEAAAIGTEPGYETSRKIIEHFNRGRMSGVDAAGYFVYNGVRIYEEGKRGEAEKRDAMTTEEKVFGRKA